LANEYNIAIAENVGKMNVVEAKEDVFDFTAQDALVSFAVAHNMKMQGGPLIWSRAAPGWINKYRGDAAKLTTIMTAYITTVMQHYSTKFPGTIIAWEVVNEAATAGLGVFAAVPDCVELAFQTARAADPNVALFYNDYGDETSGATTTKVYNLVAPLKQKGLLDAVGFQSHFGVHNAPRMSAIKTTMDSLGSIGLDVYVTEFDFSLPSANGITPDNPRDLILQGTYYNDYLATCLAAPNCKQFITWGFTDAHSWIPRFFKGAGAALPFDANYDKKPAYYGMQNALSRPAAR